MGQGGPVRGSTSRGDTTARIRIDLSELRNAPNVARQYARATAREIEQAFSQAQREQAEADRQRMAAMQATLQQRRVAVRTAAREESAAERQRMTEMRAALQQRRVAVRAAAREETEIQRQAQREQAALEKQRVAALHAALQQRRIAVRAAAREEMELQRQVAAQQQALAQQQAVAQERIIAHQLGQQQAAIARRQAMMQGAATFAGAAFGGPIGGIAGALVGGPAALPLAAGLGVSALGQAAIAAERTATAYRRQEVAAVNLAGSQQNLNRLLEAYASATGGAVDRATSLQHVTQLQAIGFADSAEELERFVRAARGISVATGQSMEYVIGQLQLTIANMSTMRLDQLGLGVAEVQQRIEQLKESNRGLSTEMAYQQAVLELAEEKFGALIDSAEGQATGMESLRRAWSDFGLELAEIARGPINVMTQALADMTDAATEGMRTLRQTGQTSVIQGGISLPTNVAGAETILAGLEAQRARVLADMESGARPMAALQADLVELDAKIRAVNVSLGSLDATARMATFGARTGIGANIRETPQAFSRFSDEQATAIRDWARAVQDIERSANRQRIDATRQYEEQRSSVIASYGKQAAREAEDFARQRANAERKHNLAILDVHEEAARQRAVWERDLNRRMDELRADSAEKRAEMEAEREERIADVQADSRERRLKMEEDFHRDQSRAQKRHRDNLLSAAARLDAFALWEERRRFAREQQEAREDHAKRIDDEREAEEKRLDEINKAHEKRLQAEQRSLDRSIRQAQEAHARQLADQQEATQRRLEQMQAAYEEQREQEDVERGIRLSRQAEDHQEQLDQMDRQHAARIAQIGRQAWEERRALDEAFKQQLIELELFWDGWEEVQKRRQDDAIELFDEWWEKVNKRFETTAPGSDVPMGPPPLTTPEKLPAFASGGFVPRTGPAFLHAGEYVLNPQTTRALNSMMGGMSQPGLVGAVAGGGMGMGSITIAPGAITIYDARDPHQTAALVRQELASFFRQAGRN